MKKLILKSFLLVLLFSITACSSDSNSNTSQNPQTVINIVSQGTWRITSYIDSGNDETNHFVGYNFTFGSGNVLTASNGTNSYIGSWSVTNGSSSSNNLDFNILFASPADFEELSDDWDILEHTNTKIRLIDISGGNGGTDYLTFEKN